jgi:phosphoribosylformimino-5-aminoimidazole carboxamide ribotide isomerase
VILYPAIDIQGGKAVRLRRGDFEQVTVFAEDPVRLAVQWQEEGAEALHVVDLDAARSGELVHFETVAAIVDAVRIPVQYGGGIRTQESLDRVAGSKVRWAVLGTAAVTGGDLLGAAIQALGDRLVVGVDCDEGMVATHGWQQRSHMGAQRFLHYLEERGVQRVVYTDVARDGMLGGPNLQQLDELAAAVKLTMVLSGGVARLDDLRRLRRLSVTNVDGVIVGRALYEKAFTLAEAMAVLR